MKNYKEMPQQWTLPNLPTPVKVLFTGFLMSCGFGLLMAGMQIMLTHGMADGEVGLSVDDVVYSYYGNRDGSKLEAKLNGSMADKAPPEKKLVLIEWARAGAPEADYQETIKPIIEQHCAMCHNAKMPMVDLTNLEVLHDVAATDEGAGIETLTRVSHIHLFGISFIFFIVGFIFSFARSLSPWLKVVVIATPFVFLILDILSWWLTKLSPSFAYLTIIGGVGYSAASAYMFVISLYQMWLAKPDSDAA